MAVFGAILIFVMGVVLIVSGAYWLTAPLDDLWAAQERVLLARGLAPQRSEAWESQARARAIPCFIVGSFCIGTILFILAGGGKQSGKTSDRSGEMSEITVGNHQLTQGDADRCHHDMAQCAEMYTPRK